MINLTVLFSALAIYIGSVIGTLGGIVYPELRNFDTRMDTFRRDYQDKVKVLKIKAQDIFIRNILNSEKLKVLFGGSNNSKQLSTSFTAEDMDKIEYEIQGLMESFYNIQKPNELFSEVIEEFGPMKGELKKVSLLGFLFSLTVPVIVVAIFGLNSSTYFDVTALFLFIIESIIFTSFINSLISYHRHYIKLEDNISELATAVTERIYDIKEKANFESIFEDF